MYTISFNFIMLDNLTTQDADAQIIFLSRSILLQRSAMFVLSGDQRLQQHEIILLLPEEVVDACHSARLVFDGSDQIILISNLALHFHDPISGLPHHLVILLSIFIFTVAIKHSFNVVDLESSSVIF